jgi:hypothetical protein
MVLLRTAMRLARSIREVTVGTGFKGWLVFVVLLCSLQMSGLVAGQEWVTENPYKVEAAFLRNFSHYVTWPANAFAAPRSPWRIGILGRDPFGDILEKTFKGRTEQGRPFQIFRADTPEELPECNIVFVAYRDPARRRAALAVFRGKPVLTVGDAPEFLQEGGIIQFEVRDRVKMSINLDQARSASLTIQTKMLEVADQVVENGVVRKLR